MIRPIERTILPSVGDVLLDSGWEIFNVCISEPGIFELADIEAELLNHRIEASNAHLHVCLLEVDSTLAIISEKEVGN